MTLRKSALVGCAALFYAAASLAYAPPLQLQLQPDTLPLEAGKPVSVDARLINNTDGLPVTDKDLKTVHTRKIHLLVIDPTLTDYQHIHPTISATPGNYRFDFTPKLSGGYRVWADVTPNGGTQQFVPSDLGDVGAPKIDKTPTHKTTVEGYHFTLSFDEVPKAGSAAMGTIRVTDRKGAPVKTLRPVMGAFAHIVGFYDDYQHIVHVHPMGKEPENDSERGGPELTFHLMPAQSGFIKLFAQVNIDGKEIFAPFGVVIK